jgi:preprotein translocase subunit SecE
MSQVNPAEFIRQVRRETAKVSWPTRKETLISSAMVLVMVTVASIFFLLVDNVVSFIIQFILGVGAR